MKQKGLSVFLALLMLCGLLCLPVGAKTAPVVCVGEATAMPGESIEIPVILRDCEKFMNIGIVIDYPAEALTLTNVKMTALGYAVSSETLNERPYLLSWTMSKSTSFNGTLAVLTFEIAAAAAPGDYEISVDFYKGKNGTYQDGVNVNYESSGTAGTVPLGLGYQSGAVHVSGGGFVGISVPEKTADGQYSIELTLDESLLPKSDEEKKQNFLIVSVYAASGTLVQVQIVPAEKEPVIRLSAAQEGKTVKIFWLDHGTPLCGCGKTVLEG